MMKRDFKRYICPDIDIHSVPAEEGFAASGGAGGGSYGDFGDLELDPNNDNY